MNQSRRSSLIEVGCNTVLGFVLALIATALVLPLFGFPATPAQSFEITLVFTGISVVRGYLVRRLFARRGGRQGQGRCHYHVDRCGVSVYRSGELVARMNMSANQLSGLALDALRASRNS